MAVPRQFPYIYATWLSKLLSGENHCEWAVWFQVHNKINKRPSSFDLDQYHIDHTALLRSVRDDLEANGYTVYIEGQNYFELVGRTAKLCGRPDLVAFRDDEALVIDCKTGKPYPSHTVQTMIYMWALPRALPKYAGLKFRGMVVYKDETTKQIAASQVNGDFVRELTSLIQKMVADEPPSKTPSMSECGFCPITDEDCGERVTDGVKPEDAPPETDLF